MKNFNRSTRKFLNKKHGLAAIQSDFSISEWSMGGSITISDCNRNINLDFSVYNSKDHAEKLNKLDLIIKELTDYRELMVTHLDSYLENQKKSKEKRKLRSKKLSDNRVVTIEELLNND